MSVSAPDVLWRRKSSVGDFAKMRLMTMPAPEISLPRALQSALILLLGVARMLASWRSWGRTR